MYPVTMFQRTTLLFLALALVSLGRAQQPAPDQLSLGPISPTTNSLATLPSSTSASALHSPPVNGSPSPSPADPLSLLLGQGLQLLEQKQLGAALAKANAAIQLAPQNANAYELRGTIYVEEKLWDQAAKDYQTALQFDAKNMQLKFNLAEIKFMQKQYDDARHDFIALEQDASAGDLATYKVFLCDLFGGHEDVAVRELDVFNQAGRNASYYFANAAWALYHHKTEDARDWLASAARIYVPGKARLYATSLINLGYLPLPPLPSQR